MADAIANTQAGLRGESASGASSGLAIWLLLAYLVITRIGHLEAAKLGGQIAGIPVFLTEIFLLLTVAALLISRPVPVFAWAVSGSRAGPVGRATWLIAILAMIHFALSFSRYRVFAARDFAIYMYSLFFILTYFSIRTRADAVRLLQGCIYSGVAAAILLIGFSVTGIKLGLYDESTRVLFGTEIVSRGGGDVGGIIGFSLAGLGAYILTDPRRRTIHVLLALFCFVAIAIPQTRSAVFGLMLAGVFSLVAVRTRHRVIIALAGIVAIGLVVASPALPPDVPGIRALQNLYYAVASGAQFEVDGNAQFRLARWTLALQTWLQQPLFGVGFGTNILPLWIENIEELNTFNYALPHNTYLTILARTGIVGFALFAFPILWTMLRIHRRMRARLGDADVLAAGNIICAMAGFGLFVLFFERPLHGASFWIMLAVAVRLSEVRDDEASTSDLRT